MLIKHNINFLIKLHNENVGRMRLENNL